MSTLVLIGKNEVIYDPQKALKRTRNQFPNIRTKLIPEAGHLLNVDQPEILNDLLQEFSFP